MTYLWENLSDYDFELVVKDLLERKENSSFEAFGPGPDWGIDVRSLTSASGLIIGQCKHYPGSSFSSLLSNAKKELPKIRKLRPPPDRYLLITSKRLSPKNKATLKKAMEPYVKSEADVLGREDIEGLLREFDDIEGRHYKLWLAGGDRLARIANAAVVGRSEFERENLLKRSKLFVDTAKRSEAQAMLRRNHVCIISGQPGVGKTTLAAMLTLEYLADNFELVSVSSDIEEAESLFNAGRRQLFVYDDFLGRTNFRGTIMKNEDKRLLSFIDRVQNAENKRFVLTRREYILRSAQQYSEILGQTAVTTLKMVLSMPAYSRLERALILYNHLYFDTRIRLEEIEYLVSEKRYVKIIDHPNFNPRMVESAINLTLHQ